MGQKPPSDKRKKRAIYNGLISIINSIRRIEINCLEHGMAFNYHKTNYRLDNNDEMAKYQGEYHQRLRDETINRLFEKVEKLDSLASEYRIQIGNDEQFEKLIQSIDQWPRPKLSRFIGTKTLSKLNELYDKEMEEKRKFASEYWVKTVEDMDNHISKKLL